jgi:Xaa-Pro aminopeptidase
VSLFESPDWTARLRALDDARRQNDGDAFLISAPANLRYLTGFNGSAGLLVTTADESILLIDGRYHTAVREEQAAGRLTAVTPHLVEGRYDAALADVLALRRVRSVAFEAAHVSVATFDAWRHRLPAVEWRRTERVVERSRQIKDEVETRILRRAGAALAGVASNRRGRVQPAGVPDHRRLRTEQCAAARVPGRSGAASGRPGGAGLRRRFGRILRRFDARGRRRPG